MAEYDFHFTAEVMDGIFGEVITARGAWDTLGERLDNIEQGAGGDTYTKAEVDTMLAEKVNTEEGKGLSSNDFTDSEKEKLAGIEALANKTVVDDALSSSSSNPVQNKVVKSALDSKQESLASTQLAAVNSGITSEDVDQIETNKNNISLNTQYCGGRNIGNFAYYGLNPDQSIAAGTITYTENNGVFTFTGTANSSKNYACYLLKRQLIKAGSYVVSGISGGSASTYWLRIGTGVSDTFKVNVTDSGTVLTLDSDTKITVQLVVKAGVSLTNKVFSPMIITAADWANSHDFQQYGESNAQLSSIVQADIDNMTEFKFARLNELSSSVHFKYGFLIGGGGANTPNKVMLWHVFVNTSNTVYFTKIVGDDTITLTGSIADGVLTITSSATIYGGLRLIWLG